MLGNKQYFYLEILSRDSDGKRILDNSIRIEKKGKVISGTVDHQDKVFSETASGHYPLQGRNSGNLYWIQEEENFKKKKANDEDEDGDDEEDQELRNHELCGIFYYQYDRTLKKFDAYRPTCRIIEFNICQDKFGMDDSLTLIDTNYDFHILETSDRKILPIRKAQTIQTMINLPIISYYEEF